MMEANLDDIDLTDGGLANDGSLAVGGPKKRHVFVRLMNGEAYNFLDKPDPQEQKMYACLALDAARNEEAMVTSYRIGRVASSAPSVQPFFSSPVGQVQRQSHFLSSIRGAPPTILVAPPQYPGHPRVLSDNNWPWGPHRTFHHPHTCTSSIRHQHHAQSWARVSKTEDARFTKLSVTFGCFGPGPASDGDCGLDNWVLWLVLVGAELFVLGLVQPSLGRLEP
jgi:hypothetical protein